MIVSQGHVYENSCECMGEFVCEKNKHVCHPYLLLKTLNVIINSEGRAQLKHICVYRHIDIDIETSSIFNIYMRVYL